MSNKKRSIAGFARRVKSEDKKVRDGLNKPPKGSELAAIHAASHTQLGAASVKTLDSFVNFAQKLGVGADNPLSTSSYGFNPITRVRIQLEWMYRGSWIAGAAVDLIADDMTKMGVDFKGDIEPEHIDALNEAATGLGVWPKINKAIKWSRLYGGAIAVMMIDGQSYNTPLRLESIGKDQFKGLFVLDRWSMIPSLNDLVTEPGPDIGLPKYYVASGDSPALANVKIHHSRVIRLIGIEMPYYQRTQEDLWGISVLERLYDRMIAFDSATTGLAQLIYRAYIRTYKIKGLREVIANGGEALKGLIAQIDLMRRYQGTEGVTLLDMDDEMVAMQRTGTNGMDEALDQFGQQLAGALQIPLVRLFGQSPKGLNPSGEAELRTYYDGIKQRQETDIMAGTTRIYRAIARSKRINLPEGFGLEFKNLWQLTEQSKAEIAERTGSAVGDAFDRGLITQQGAMKELRQSSDTTGIFTNITDKDINGAEEDLPPTGEDAMRLQAELMGSDKDGDDPDGKEPKTPEQKQRQKVKDSNTSQKLALLKLKYDLDIVIENQAGTWRKGVGVNGKEWRAQLAADYGEIAGTTGADGDRVDCFVGPNALSERVWLISQVDPLTREFDEMKTFVGFDDLPQVLAAYAGSYSDMEDRVGNIKQMAIPQFKAWLASANRPRLV